MDVTLAITGFGNVGRGLAELLDRYGGEWSERYGLALRVTGIADRGGAAIATSGLDLAKALRVKAESGTVAALGGGHAGLAGGAFLDRAQAQVLVEAASTNFRDAEPGWSYVCDALNRDMDIVLASKGSLALHWEPLMEMARTRSRRVSFSATIGAPLPTLDVADRSLVGTRITGFEAIVNGTTHQILTAMARGATYEEGVRQAQEMGIAETDPTLDVDGWDAAAKVLIMANAVLNADLGLSDVRREGIRGVTAADLSDAARNGQVIKLIGRAVRTSQGVEAGVKPERRSVHDALGRLSGDDMGVVFHTEPIGLMTATVEPRGAGGGIATAMTVLRDVFNLARDRGWTPPRHW